jgi:hypothetical protein
MYSKWIGRPSFCLLVLQNYSILIMVASGPSGCLWVTCMWVVRIETFQQWYQEIIYYSLLDLYLYTLYAQENLAFYTSTFVIQAFYILDFHILMWTQYGWHGLHVGWLETPMCVSFGPHRVLSASFPLPLSRALAFRWALHKSHHFELFFSNLRTWTKDETKVKKIESVMHNKKYLYNTQANIQKILG